MTTSLVITCCAFIGFAISESTILTTPSDVSSCSGENVTIAWTYNPANLVTAIWTFTNGTLTEEEILSKITTFHPTAPSSSPLNIEFVENGTIQLISTSPSYSGTYEFSITDTSANIESDSVNITINDVPQALVIQENVTTNTITITCSGSSSIPTVIRVSTSGGFFRYEASPYTSSVTTEGIECCYNGSAASCSNETFTATYDGTIYCQQVRDASTTVPPTLFTTTQITHNTTDPAPCSPWCPCNLLECILASVIPPLIVIGGCIAGAIFYCRPKEKCCFKVKKNKTKVRNGGSAGNKSDGSDETENRPLSTTVETTNETSPETKSLQSTKHDGSQVNNQVVQTEGSSPSPIKKGHSKVVPDDNKIGSKESSQAPNMGDVEANKPKKKKKGKETKEDQIV